MDMDKVCQKPSTVPNGAQQLQMDRKYGMFIHFGINTFNGMEWSDGTLDPKSYAPSSINTDHWIKTAYEAGMNYVILTTKHHEGFCLWPSEYTHYGVVSSRNKTDVVKKVAESCEKYGIKLGLYYSLWDRNASSYEEDEKYVEYMKNQLTELLDRRYGEIVELWLDGGWEKKSSQWKLDELYHLTKSLQPDCVVGVNQTIGEYDTVGMTMDKDLPIYYKENDEMKFFPSDFRLWDPNFTREGVDGDPKLYTHQGQQYYLPFEATICIRNMTNWFWDAQYTSDPTVTPRFIADKYHHMLEQSNILVVNVAPNPDGRIEAYDKQTLYEAARMIGIAKGNARE
jgi:alpha-L-fucosidase